MYGSILGLALDHGGWADWAGAWSGGWALGRFRAFDFRAARARAWWAISLGFSTFAAIKYNWHWLWHRTLKHIVT